MNKEQRFVDVNGEQVLDLTPDYDRALALVDLEVLKRLASLLPSANLHRIKRDFIESVRDTENIEQFTAILSEELAFHTTVNVIKEVNEPRSPEVIGHMDID